MSMTTDELKKYIYNPHLMQKYVLDKISEYNGGENTISDPSNPFVFLLEATCANASNAILEANSVIRKKYPSLANSEDEIIHHINDNISDNIFSTPSEAIIDLYVSVPDIINSGYRPEGAEFYQTTIPANTKIIALDTTFTILNPINVRLYDNGSIFVEQQLNNDIDIAYQNVTTLESTIYNTDQNTTFIVFRTKVKQVDFVTINKTIIVSNGFKQSVKFNNKYCSSSIVYKQNNESSYKSLVKYYNDEYINPLEACCYVSVYDGEVVYRIPDVYLVEGLVSGNVQINTYFTMGKIYVPLNRLLPTDFEVKLGDTTANESTSTIEKIGLLAASTSIVDGGSNGMSYDDIKSLVINNSVSPNNIPITDNQLSQSVSLLGYQLFKSQDVITGREYLALKSLPDLKSHLSLQQSSLILAKQDVFFNYARLVLSELQNRDDIVISNEYFIIKSNTLFINDNGVIVVMSNEQKKYIQNLSKIALITYLKTNKIFYNPFYYILETSDTSISCRIYDLDNPDITSYRILNKNDNVLQSVNIDKYAIEKMEYGYRILISLTGSIEFTELDQSKTKLQLKLPIFNGTSYVTIDSTYDQDLELYEFQLQTDFIIDSNDMLTITNGNSNLFTKRFTLDLIAYVYIMSFDQSVVDEKKYLLSEIDVQNDIPVIFSKESITIKFGTRLNYLYYSIFNTYSTRRYKTYQEDVPATYTKNVYEVDPKTGSPFKCNVNVLDHIVEFNLKHVKGDPILDDGGNPVYLHRKGDNVLDKDGNLIIDQYGGIIRYLNILMLEYEFYIAESVAYKEYKRMVIDVLYNYITNDMKSINNKLLENTVIYYKSYKSNQNVGLTVNSAVSYVSYNIYPKVKLYIMNVSKVESDVLNSYKTTIGKIINEHLDKTIIKLEDIRNEIKTSLGSNISSVKIEGIDNDNNEVIYLQNNMSKLTLNKILDFNTNNELIVKYDISLEVQYI